MAISHRGIFSYIIQITSYSPEDQGLHYHLSVQQHQGYPKERGHKPNMNTIQTETDAATQWSKIKRRKGIKMWTVNSRWRCLASFKHFFVSSLRQMSQFIVFITWELKWRQSKTKRCFKFLQFLSFCQDYISLMFIWIVKICFTRSKQTTLAVY